MHHMAATRKKFIIVCLIVSVFAGIAKITRAQCITMGDQICGKWMSEDKNLSVQVYKDGDRFKARIIWFDDSDDKSRPMDTRLDTENPDVDLRFRKILGMSVLEKLIYQPKTNSWEKGVIYDALHGRYWDSSASITPDGLLKVTGYWHFKFIGKTLKFTRI